MFSRWYGACDSGAESVLATPESVLRSRSGVAPERDPGARERPHHTSTVRYVLVRRYVALAGDLSTMGCCASKQNQSASWGSRHVASAGSGGKPDDAIGYVGEHGLRNQVNATQLPSRTPTRVSVSSACAAAVPVR